MSRHVIVTDNGMTALRRFPQFGWANIITTFNKAVTLPSGTRVAVLRFSVGTGRNEACAAAEALIRKGVFQRADIAEAD